jgi:hypothetical protein
VIFFYLNTNENSFIALYFQSVIFDGKHTSTVMKDMENYSFFVPDLGFHAVSGRKIKGSDSDGREFLL